MLELMLKPKSSNNEKGFTLVELQTYIRGGTASLGSPKGNPNVSAHVLGGTSPTGTLTSTYDIPNTWIYDQSK